MASSRRQGIEWRALVWFARHPGALIGPGTVAGCVVALGQTVTAAVAAGLVVGVVGWYRGHPASFDRWAAPWLRAWRRRWFSRYAGRGWQAVTAACDLATVQRGTDHLLYPRIVRMFSPSPSVDVLRVRMRMGQSARMWEQKTIELADSLRAERVAVERVRPGLLGLIVQRDEPFTEPVEPLPMPHEAAGVRVGKVWFGIDEYGHDWHEPIAGQHFLTAGATGAGKATLMHGPAYQLAPLIKAGLVRFWDIDPKQMELSPTQAISYRYAAEPEAMLEVLEEYMDDEADSQRRLAAAGLRKAPISLEYPLNILRVDELGAVLAYGDHGRIWRKSLAIAGTQGRASGHLVWGFVQEPSKDVVPIRDMFTRRICLRVTAAAHVDMTLGEDARARGALADEIPNDITTAGIGFVIRPRTRLPLRVRAGHYTDTHLRQLVGFVTGTPADQVRLGAAAEPREITD